MSKKLSQQGFTLLEMLMALFIFTILSLILTSALHNVINLQKGVETHAERLRNLQMTLLIMSRNVEQAVNRAVIDSAGKEEAAFLGSIHGFTLTHAGHASPIGAEGQSIFQRDRYDWDGHSLWRRTWPDLDHAPDSQAHGRELLTEVTDMQVEYLDADGQFHHDWPIENQTNQPLPRAIRIYLTISKWGSLSQLYVIPSQQSNNLQATNKQS